MNKLKLFSAVAASVLAIAGAAHAQPVQWNYSVDNTGTALATYPGNVLMQSNITGTGANLTAGHVITNANLTGDVTSVGNATTLANIPAIAGTNLTGTAANLTAGHVTTNANSTGDVTSVGNATTYNNVVPTNKGGWGDAGTAPAAYTPTAACGTGSLTNASTSGDWKQVGKLLYVYARIAITTNGTCNGITLTLPNSLLAAKQATLLGSEFSVTGAAWTGRTAVGLNTFFLQNYANGATTVDGETIEVGGWIEVQ